MNKNSNTSPKDGDSVATATKFSQLPVERQMLASQALADHLLATNTINQSISRDVLVQRCHALLLIAPDSAFD